MKNITKQFRDLAILYHGEQKYGDEPYVYHLDNVFQKVLFLYSDKDVNIQDLLIVALLHDILEDTDISISTLYMNGLMDDHVHAIQAISKVKGESLEKYYIKVSNNFIAWCVKIADTLSNLEHSLQENNSKRINKYTTQIQVLHKLGQQHFEH